ncbi:Glyoxalase domain-containing protein 4 [Halotydeus destructor]|nr:Glyoxalase domain-containing protein 4 [Halotydeus destructor]
MATVQTSARALHWVFKIADRKKSIFFFRDVLKMNVLRHEEFEKGCEATCNGRYDGHWSKTMIGYGTEDTDFVYELTYNYPVLEPYKLGNAYRLSSLEVTQQVIDNVKKNYEFSEENGKIHLTAPDGYPIILKPGDKNRVEKVAIAVSDLQASIRYWSGLLGMAIISQTETNALLSYSDVSGFSLELCSVAGTVDHATASGRVAFSYAGDLPGLEDKMIKSGQGTIINSLISLDTPGKATVQVVILGDPDGHEICFVGDEGFRQLGDFDPNANELLDKSIAADKSKK